MNKKLVLSSLDETKELAEKIASFLRKEKNFPISIHLSGDLGTGKTTLVKEVLNCLGIENFINSPTFTLIEPYEINDLKIFHIDLYRVENNRAKRDRFRRISTRSKFHQLYRMTKKDLVF